MDKRKKTFEEIEVEKKLSIKTYFMDTIVKTIPDYFANYPVNLDYKPFVCCPLHEEDTPSFKYYEDTNSFYCFGCGKGGGVVLLHKYFVKLHFDIELTMDEAAKQLYNKYIKGLQVAELVFDTGLVNEINSNPEKMRYKYYENQLEKTLAIDKSLSEDKRRQIYKKMDLMNTLIDVNEIKTEEAKNEINNILKQG